MWPCLTWLLAALGWLAPRAGGCTAQTSLCRLTFLPATWEELTVAELSASLTS